VPLDMTVDIDLKMQINGMSLFERDVEGLADSIDQKRTVKIHLSTVITNDEEKEEFELVLFGEYFEKGGSVYLKYTEVQEEGTVRTIVKMSGEEAVILRNGAVKSRLVFDKNHPMSGSYDSPYGTLLLNTITRNMDRYTYSEKPLNGRLALTYDLFMQGKFLGIYSLTITFKEVKNV